MDNPSFKFLAKSKRDLLRTRQLVRHAAAVLGFNRDEQACLSAAAFDLACQAYRVAQRAETTFEVSDRTLHLGFQAVPKQAGPPSEAQPSFRLTRNLPEDARVSPHDLLWALEQLVRHAPLDLFDEMVTVNRELLQALLNQSATTDILTLRAA